MPYTKYRYTDAKHPDAYKKECTFICDKCKRYLHVKLKVIESSYAKFLKYDDICYKCYHDIFDTKILK